MSGTVNARPVLIPTRYALPWTRLKNGEPWMCAEVVARAFNKDGSVASWAIHELGCVLNTDGEWEIEPQPSSRDDDFINRTRFLTAEAAAEFAQSRLANGLSDGKGER